MADSHPAATAHDRQTSRVNPPSPSSPEAFVLYFAANVNGRCADGCTYASIRPCRSTGHPSRTADDRRRVSCTPSIRQLYPIPRSLTGERGQGDPRRPRARSPARRGGDARTGTEVFDWVVPREWNVRDAWIEAPDGRRLARFRDSSLNLLGYSVPVDETAVARRASASTSSPIPEHPDRVPYRTSYCVRALGLLHDAARGRLAPRGEYRGRDRRDAWRTDR